MSSAIAADIAATNSPLFGICSPFGAAGCTADCVGADGALFDVDFFGLLLLITFLFVHIVKWG